MSVNSNENIKYEVLISTDAQDFFESAEVSLQKKLDRCFKILKISPRNHPNIKPLKGIFSGSYRYRVGNYRVIYEINETEKEVIIILILHRSKVYKQR